MIHFFKSKCPTILEALSALCIVTMWAGQSAIGREVVLQDSKILVGFNSETGALTRLVDKTTGWTMERRPQLGLSFRMLVPLSNRQDNFVLGSKQRAVRVEKVSNDKVVMEWKNLLSEHGGVLPITFKAFVTLKKGVLTFGGSVINNSRLTVQTVDYPYFGDFNPPTKDTPMSVRTMWYGSLGNQEIYPKFVNTTGYWGIFFPTKTFDSYKSLFCLVQTPKQGLYIQIDDPAQRYMMQYTFDLHPGPESQVTNAVPREGEIEGKPVVNDMFSPVGAGTKERGVSDNEVPVHLDFRICNFVFTHPGHVFKLAPVVMRCYQGDWHTGVDIYKQWRKTWFKEPKLPAWMKKVNSWEQLQVNSPIQDYRIPYDSLVNYGRACAENGVSALEIVGWNDGGQDGHDPCMATDPHLGTWQQFHDAIQKIQAMGVHVILFGKLNWADLTTKWYKTELYKYQCTDPYGIPYQTRGYSYFTPVQLAGMNNHKRAVMDMLDPAYRKVALGQFDKLLSLGASGWFWDEVLQHGPVTYNFAKGHGYTPPGFVYAGDIPMAKELRAAADSVNPNFVFGGEGPEDWLMQYYPIAETGDAAVYIDTRHCYRLSGVAGFNDRERLNYCLARHSIIEYKPYEFKGMVTDYPLTLAYGKKIDALRRKYKAYLWDAEYRDDIGAKVTSDGRSYYSVFLTSTGKRAVVVVNEETQKSIMATVQIPHHGKLVTATPEHPDAVPTSGVLNIPARSAAVVMEQ